MWEFVGNNIYFMEFLFISKNIDIELKNVVWSIYLKRIALNAPKTPLFISFTSLIESKPIL
jgi:hypothetical protein